MADSHQAKRRRGIRLPLPTIEWTEASLCRVSALVRHLLLTATLLAIQSGQPPKPQIKAGALAYPDLSFDGYRSKLRCVCNDFLKHDENAAHYSAMKSLLRKVF